MTEFGDSQVRKENWSGRNIAQSREHAEHADEHCVACPSLRDSFKSELRFLQGTLRRRTSRFLIVHGGRRMMHNSMHRPTSSHLHVARWVAGALRLSGCNFMWNAWRADTSEPEGVTSHEDSRRQQHQATAAEEQSTFSVMSHFDASRHLVAGERQGRTELGEGACRRAMRRDCLDPAPSSRLE